MFFKKRPLYIIDKQMKKSFEVFFVFEKKGAEKNKNKNQKNFKFRFDILCWRPLLSIR